MADVTRVERLKALETVNELIALYDGARRDLWERSSESTDYRTSRRLDNEAGGMSLMVEKLQGVRAVIEDAANRRRRRPRT